MKAFYKSVLCAALGLVAARAGAQELQWRPAGGGMSLGAPQPAAGASRPTLGAPQPAAGTPRATLGPPVTLVRGQSAEERPLPAGPALLTDAGRQDSGPGKVDPPRPPRPVAPVPDPAKPVIKDGAPEPIGPPAKVAQPPAAVWGSLAPPTAAGPVASTDDCNDACGTACCTSRWRLRDRFGWCKNLFGHCFGDACGTACGTETCGAFGDCCPDRPAYWVSGEYLLWWVRDQNIPPLVTAAPAGAPVVGGIPAGALGNPFTTVLLDSLDNDVRSGARFSAGFWFRRHENLGLDASYYFLGNRDNQFTATATPATDVFRPLIDPFTGAPFVELTGLPGTVGVTSYSRLWGMDINLRKRHWCGCSGWGDLLLGYRHFELAEGISITENFTVPVPGGATFAIADNFHTRNYFNGPQVGITGEWRFAQRWALGGTAKVGVGVVHQDIIINGSQTITAPGAATAVFPVGILAAQSNSGRFSTDRFAVMPEVGVKLYYDLGQRVRLFAGYDFIYLSSAVRPGDQIDVRLDPRQVPPLGALVGTGQPGVAPVNPFQTTSFWTQGVNFGMQFRW